MSPRPSAGKHRRRQKGAPPPQTPLDYALDLMRDQNLPVAVRASMAKAALPYLHHRLPSAEPPPPPEPERPPMSRIELARRVAFLLDSTNDEAGIDEHIRAGGETG